MESPLPSNKSAPSGRMRATAATACGYDFSGVVAPEDGQGLYSVRYAEFVVPLVKAVQELAGRASGQQAEIEELKDSEIRELKAENAALKVQLDKITAALQEMGVEIK